MVRQVGQCLIENEPSAMAGTGFDSGVGQQATGVDEVVSRGGPELEGYLDPATLGAPFSQTSCGAWARSSLSAASWRPTS